MELVGLEAAHGHTVLVEVDLPQKAIEIVTGPAELFPDTIKLVQFRRRQDGLLGHQSLTARWMMPPNRTGRERPRPLGTNLKLEDRIYKSWEYQNGTKSPLEQRIYDFTSVQIRKTSTRVENFFARAIDRVG